MPREPTAPLLAPGWIARLVALIGQNDLAIPRVDGHDHPLAAVYRRATVLPALDRLLGADRLRLGAIVAEVRTRLITADELRPIDPQLATLRNVNSPDDYRAALSAAGFAADRNAT